jgi:hypothetical protein
MSNQNHRIFYGWFIVAACFINLFMTTGIGFYAGVFILLIAVFAISAFLIFMAKPPKLMEALPAQAVEGGSAQ